MNIYQLFGKRGGGEYMNAKTLHMVTFLLVVIGGINWGLVGLLNFNLVNLLLGFMPVLEKVVYILVGASAVYLVMGHKNDCKICGKK